MNITDVIFSWLLRSALIGLVILLIGSGAVLVWREPVRRLRMIELVLCACLLAPFLGMVPGYPQLSIVVWHPAAIVTRSVSEERTRDLANASGYDPFAPRPEYAASDRGAPPIGVDNAVAAPAPARDIRAWIVSAYLAGVALAIGWWLVGLAGLMRVMRTAKPAPPRCRELFAEISAGRGNRVRLLTSNRLNQPFASVWGRATIVLPEDLCGDERALRWCLAHEWSHIARHDFRAWLLAGLVRAIFFYQPLVWWLRRQLRLCQDYLADAQAAGQASQAEDYAEFLTTLVAKGKWRPAALGLGMRPGKSELYRRVIMLLKNQPLEDRAPRSWTVSATAAAMALAALAAAISFVPRAVAEEKPVAKQAAGTRGGSASAPTNRAVTDVGITTVTGYTMVPSDYLRLPAYRQLGNASVRQQYHLNADQQKKLESISRNFDASNQEFQKTIERDLAKLPPQERSAKRAELMRKIMHDEMVAGRKKIEEALTEEQIAAYRHDELAGIACFLWEPRQRDVWRLNLSPEQARHLELLGIEFRREAGQNALQKSKQLLAMLSPEQRRVLMTSYPTGPWDASVPFVILPARNYVNYAGGAYQTGPVNNAVDTAQTVDTADLPLFLATDSHGAYLIVCPPLTENVVRKELGLNRQQQDTLLATAKQYQVSAQQAFKTYPATKEASDKLSPEEQKTKRAACERELKEIGSDAIRRVETTLGPQRWDALKSKVQEQYEVYAVGGVTSVNDALLRKLNITPQQRAKLRESENALASSSLKWTRQTGDRALAVLSDEQRKKLEEYLDQQGW